ncbi:MAG TPA: hypothetical protein VGO62_00680 [Myxococcota bacterium]|jgi:hypothetical protein
MTATTLDLATVRFHAAAGFACAVHGVVDGPRCPDCGAHSYDLEKNDERCEVRRMRALATINRRSWPAFGLAVTAMPGLIFVFPMLVGSALGGPVALAVAVFLFALVTGVTGAPGFFLGTLAARSLKPAALQKLDDILHIDRA